MSQAKLGDKVRDKVTGFTGIMSVLSIYLTGCSRAGVQPKIGEDGKVPEAMYFDLPMLEVLESEVVTPIPTEKGGPRDAPKQHNAPR